MERTLRAHFNAAFTNERYRRVLDRIETRLGCSIPFRVAETPLFIPRDLRLRLVRHATEIVDEISRPALIAKLADAIPSELDVPRVDSLCNCIQVDFAIARNEAGELDGRLVELQGFPSLYALTAVEVQAWSEELATMPGLARPWTCLFNDPDHDSFVRRFRHAVLGGCDPEEVILMDLDPTRQKTYPDFVATREMVGIDAVCPTTLERDGRRLFRRVGDRRVQVRRIYNRVVFDELEKSGVTLPFAYNDDLDVTWFPHPNWYWIWSKNTVPFIEHPSVPRATLLSRLAEIPDDLENYVLKPLFSFAGAGVKVDVTRADIDAVPSHQRGGWMLQRKIVYEPGIVTPEGHGVKAEVRMMFMRAPDEPKPTLTLNLVRLSRGKMLGVDQNKDFDWVGGTVGIWPADEA